MSGVTLAWYFRPTGEQFNTGLCVIRELRLSVAFGRNQLQELLKYNKKSELLQALDISETELLKRWEEFIIAYQP